jgi:hypothetical protein
MPSNYLETDTSLSKEGPVTTKEGPDSNSHHLGWEACLWMPPNYFETHTSLSKEGLVTTKGPESQFPSSWVGSMHVEASQLS